MSFTEQQYQDTLTYLEGYVHDDWLGFSVLVGSAGQLLGPGAGDQDYCDLSLRIVDDLLARGAVAGDLTASDSAPFEPWGLDRETTLMRMRHEIATMNHLPESGDIGWLTVP